MVTKEDLEKDYVDAGEARKMLGLSGSRMSRLCTSNRFPGAFKFGSIWIIPREAVLNHTKLKPGVKRGRPRKVRAEGEDAPQKRSSRLSRSASEAAATGSAQISEAPKKRGRPKGSTTRTKAKTVTKSTARTATRATKTPRRRKAED